LLIHLHPVIESNPRTEDIPYLPQTSLTNSGSTFASLFTHAGSYPQQLWTSYTIQSESTLQPQSILCSYSSRRSNSFSEQPVIKIIIIRKYIYFIDTLTIFKFLNLLRKNYYHL